MIPQDIRAMSQSTSKAVRTRRSSSAAASYKLQRQQYVSERAAQRRQIKTIDGVKRGAKKITPDTKLVPVDLPVATKSQPLVNRAQPVVYRAKPTTDIIPKAKLSNTTTASSAPKTDISKNKEKIKKKKPKKNVAVRKRDILLGSLVAIILLGTAYVSVDTWITNRQLARQTYVGASRQSDSLEEREATEGEDESEVSSDSIAKYVVAENLPRVLSIDKIGVKARILQMGVNPNGNMQAPINIFDSGWYTGSSKPGEKGAAVIDAHASGATRQGLFAYLNTLSNGDIIKIERGDGKVLKYKVVDKETREIDKVDMKKLMTVSGGADEGLNLITCDGKWSQKKGTFDKRTIVYTVIAK